MDDKRNFVGDFDIFEFGSDGYVLGIDTPGTAGQKKKSPRGSAEADSGRLGQDHKRNDAKKVKKIFEVSWSRAL